MTEDPEKKKCPRCSSYMVLRKSKTGRHKDKFFYGCCNFPRCQGVIPIPDDKQPKPPAVAAPSSVGLLMRKRAKNGW